MSVGLSVIPDSQQQLPSGAEAKALHLSARGVTIDPVSHPGCITTGRDLESHRAAYNWPSVVQV